MTVSLVAVILLLACEWLIRREVEPNDLFARHVHLLMTSRQADAVFGDSFSAFDLTGLPGMVNLAYPGDNFRDMQKKIEKFYRGRKPGRVLLPADPHMLGRRRMMDFNGRIMENHIAASTSLLHLTNPEHRFKLYLYWTTFLRKGHLAAVREFQPDGAQLDSSVWTRKPPEERRKESEQLCKNNAPVERFSECDQAHAFLAICKFLQNQGAQVMLLRHPVSTERLEFTENDPTVAAVDAFFQGQARRFGFAYLDCRRAVSEQDLFCDDAHLNARGARMFSGQLLRRLSEK